MQIKIVCFGKMDEKIFLPAMQEYQKRLAKNCHLEIVELKEANFSELQKNQKVNSQTLMTYLNGLKDFMIYFLDVESQFIDSLNFAKLIEKVQNQAPSKLCFVIGPSNGYDPKIKKLYPGLSFGSITFPHQLFRVVLLEQIYRSFKIINHQKYHK